MPTEKTRKAGKGGKGGRPKGTGRPLDPKLRGTQRKDRHETVLGEADNETIIDELRRFAPLCTIAAKLNVSRKTLAAYVHATPELESELQDRDESMVDLTERALFDASIGNVARDSKGVPQPINVNAATFLLERKGRQRGFAQHVEVEHEEVPQFTFSRRDSSVKAEGG